MRRIIRIPVIVAAVFLFLFFAWNWFLYSLGFEQKVEQYDEHIALYVTNTFVRTRFRYPHYMYEENWLFMRSLSDEEQQEAVLKYGDPDDYTGNIINGRCRYAPEEKLQLESYVIQKGK